MLGSALSSSVKILHHDILAAVPLKVQEFVYKVIWSTFRVPSASRCNHRLLLLLLLSCSRHICTQDVDSLFALEANRNQSRYSLGDNWRKREMCKKVQILISSSLCPANSKTFLKFSAVRQLSSKQTHISRLKSVNYPFLCGNVFHRNYQYWMRRAIWLQA